MNVISLLADTWCRVHCFVEALLQVLRLGFYAADRLEALNQMAWIKLNTGAVMPALSLGFAKRDDRIVDAIGSAIEIGYRGFHTADLNYTEPLLAEALAKAFKAGLVRREDLFVMIKLDPYEDPVTALKKSLSALQLDYVDLYLIHFPAQFKKDTLLKELKPGEVLPTEEELWQMKRNYLHFKPRSGDMIPIQKEQWQEMERCVELGLTKAIGMSNFSIKKIEELLLHAKIPPAVNQVLSASCLLLVFSRGISFHARPESLCVACVLLEVIAAVRLQ